MKPLPLLVLLVSTRLLFAAASPPSKLPEASPASEIKGREIVAKMLAMKPSQSLTNFATLLVQAKRAKAVEIPVSIEVRAGETNWSTVYRTKSSSNTPATFALTVTCGATGSNGYELRRDSGDSMDVKTLAPAETMVPFAGSDYWVADLGMEFLHWPVQRHVTNEVCRSQSCYRIESIAPAGQTNGYVRVVSWTDIDSFNAGFVGLVLVETYDASGRMLKDFRPTVFKKVNGEYQVEEMEMRNLRTKSSTVLRFKLETK